MTVILQAVNGGDLQVNQWIWRPTNHLIADALGLDASRTEKLAVNGIGAALSPDEAERLSRFLTQYLAGFPRDGRLGLNGTVGTGPKPEAGGYSVNYEWLARFREFCRVSGGFTII